MPAFSGSSLGYLAKATPKLQRLFAEVIRHRDCSILNSLRTEAEEAQMVASGKSTTMHSKHLAGPDGLAQAVDVAPYPQRWDDAKDAKMTTWEVDQVYFAGFVMGVAAMLGIDVRYGGDWNSDDALVGSGFRDLDHVEVVES